MASTNDDIQSTVLPPLPPSPPPSLSNPPMPPEVSNLDVTENNHLDIEQALGDDSVSFACKSPNSTGAKRKTFDEMESGVGKKAKVALISSNEDINCFNGPGGAEGKKVEFDVLDEVKGDDDEQDDRMYHSDSESMSDGIDADEIEAMLDESFQKNFGKPGRLHTDQSFDNEDLKHEVREKIVMKALGKDHFEFLPDGWIEVTHHSGMPVYLHKESRVCTFSPPYFLGPGSARKHEVPMSAIPCLNYAKELEKLKSKSEVNNIDEGNDGTISKANLPDVKVENVDQIMKETSLDALALRDYCKRIFQFHPIIVRKFKTWASKRKHQKLLKQKHRPTLPSDTKLITCQVQPNHGSDSNTANKAPLVSKEFVMNPTGKSYVCILHEYVQHSMRVQPKYKYKELENASHPYASIVNIKDMEYGTGYGSSKKQAKSEAAKNTLEILIPQMKNLNVDSASSKSSCLMPGIQEQDLSFFDEVRVEDPRVHELCTKAGLSSPFQLLLECLKRNYGMGDTEVKFETKMMKHQKNDFTMTVGKHKASVICKNKRDGKQRASQAILQALHPHITCWGSLIRLYGKGSCKTIKEKKQEEQLITELQNKACANKPNYSILAKLKEEMTKLKNERDKVKPIGKFIPTDDEIPSISASDIKNVDL